MSEMSPDDAIAQCDRICDLIDDDVPEWAQEKAPDFFEDVKASVIEVQETIIRTQQVSAGQAQALFNWEQGVRKWLPDHGT